MRLRVRADELTALLLAALGAAPLASCGGIANSSTEGSGGGTSGAGGSNDDGGPSTGTAGGVVTGGAGGTILTGTGGGGGAANDPFPCVAPTSTLNGYVTCRGGLVHRAAQVMCDSVLPRPGAVTDGGVNGQGCHADSECTDHPHGYCTDYSLGPSLSSYCNYGCVADEECGPESICVCGAPVGHCAPAACTSDAQCQPGFLCARYDSMPGCDGEAFACQTASDTCGGDADCATSSNCGLVSGSHTCQRANCAIGRPFLIEGAERIASSIARSDWQQCSRLLATDQFSVEQRASLGAAWIEVALMEHASIAAFARFTLQLMSLGAPAHLVESAGMAMADETKHARLAFALGSAFVGRDVGPSPLDCGGALDRSSLRDIVLTTVREACLGETVAALQAAEALEHSNDPVLRDVLSQIVADETRHAELGWRFVAWALAQPGAEELGREVAEEFACMRRECPVVAEGPLEGPEEAALLLGGIVPPQRRQAVRAFAVHQVVNVCARALFRVAEPEPGDSITGKPDARSLARLGVPTFA